MANGRPLALAAPPKNVPWEGTKDEEPNGDGMKGQSAVKATLQMTAAK